MTNTYVHAISGASGGGGGSGTVTSVAVTVPARQTVAGSPVTTAGTIAITDNTQNANLFFGGPVSGPAAAPGFRNVVTADLPSGFEPAQTPTQNQYYYVSGSSGNDTTGDGTYNNPFATVMHAMGLITTAGASNRFIIKIIGSKLQEPANIVLKGYVYIVGDHLDGTYIRINGGSGSITPDPTTTVSARCGLQNIYLGGGTSINWGLFDNGPNTGTPSCLLALDNVTVTGNFAFKGRTPTIDYLEMYNCYIFGTTDLDACQNSSNTCTYQGATTLSSINGGSDSQFTSCLFLGGVTITSTATYTNVEQLSASSITGGALTITDAASLITLTSDSASYPVYSEITVTGTPTITLLNDAYGTLYTPATPANWGTVPTTIQQALDLIAAHLNPV